jgi:hypothetical protein
MDTKLKSNIFHRLPKKCRNKRRICLKNCPLGDNNEYFFKKMQIKFVLLKIITKSVV